MKQRIRPVMPQSGFHGLVGLAIVKALGRRVPTMGCEPFAAGIALGAMIPDVDMYPAAIAFLFRRDLTYAIHRSLTHSLLAILLVLLVGAIWGHRSRGVRAACVGLAIGMLAHDLLDVVFWFAPIAFLWPLNILPASQGALTIDLWQGWKPPTLVLNIRESCEYLAFALLLYALRQIAQSGGRKGRDLRRLRRWEIGAWAYFALTFAAAFLLRESQQNVMVTAPYLLLFFPFCAARMYHLRFEITRWSMPKRRGTS